MTVESVTNIADLNASNPALDDPKSEGDDHIRNIKTALLTDLPNITGPITATQDELNAVCDGDTSDSAITVASGDLIPVNDSGTMVQTDVDDIALHIKTLNNGGLNTKVIEIGDWNMDATSAVSVTHGLTLDKIRNVDVLVREDGGTSATKYPLARIVNSADATIGGSVTQIGSTTVALTRVTGGIFDATLFSSTSYNRGWVTIQYVD
jgi:hypothetical protein